MRKSVLHGILKVMWNDCIPGLDVTQMLIIHHYNPWFSPHGGSKITRKTDLAIVTCLLTAQRIEDLIYDDVPLP